MVVAQPVDEAADVVADHLLAADDFAPARLDGLADDALERVNIVEEDAIQIVHGGFHIAWHRQSMMKSGRPGRAFIMGAS